MNYKFRIKLGVPEIEDYINDLKIELTKSKPDNNKIKILKKLKKTITLLAMDPRYPSLNSHEISILTNRYGHKIFESYIENNTPSAGRIFWVYGPDKDMITIIAIEPHPNDKNNSYKKITLSNMNLN